MRRIVHNPRWGILFNPGALWLGLHYSPHNKRVCVNIVPGLTVWVTKAGGHRP